MKSDGLLKLELKISHLLRWGVLFAGAFMLMGWISFLDFTQNPLAAFHDYREETLSQSLTHAFETHDWGLLLAYLGLMILISLPLLRVLMTGVLFVKQKEKTLAVVAFFVFAILILSFSLGIEI
ncbi:DUF1634 domain-containing protein [Bdellovibrio sp. HCB337]|uniref:DUF1634 domain-containing protein n=1 Tax=Bdellovibrio sp. HCB337 TaxID=3394358 RepID=UPI0039A6FCBF